MRQTLYIFIFIMVSLIAGCTDGGNGERKATQNDTLYTDKAVLKIYGEHPRQALAMIDSGEAAGTIQPHIATYLRAKVYGYPSDVMNCDTARQMCIGLLSLDETKADLDMRYDVLDQLRAIAYVQKDDEDLLRWSTQLVEVCRQQGDATGALRTQAEIAFTLCHLGQRDKGLKMLDKVIAALDGKRKFNELDACIIAMKRKLIILNENGMASEAITLAARLMAKCDDYRQHPTEYHDGSFREPTSENVEGYCSFYYSQALAQAAKACAESGDNAQARRYVDQFEATDYGRTLDGRMMIAPTWLKMERYDKMLVTYEERVRQMGSDTLNTEYAEMLKGRAIASWALHQHSSSQNYWQRYANITNILNEKMLKSRAQSYAARFHAQEQDAIIQQKDLERKWNLALTALGILAALIAVGFAIYFYRQQRLLSRKNQVITEQINEAMSYKAKYMNLIRNQATAPARTTEVEKPVPDTADSAVSPMDTDPHVSPRNMTDEELFVYLSELILRERLYLNPSFGRQSLVDKCSVSAHRIGAAFARGSQYNSLPDFIRDCRLQYACKLLLEQTDMSISEVATASGFNHLAAFSRVFKDKYSMSPSDYRNNTMK